MARHLFLHSFIILVYFSTIIYMKDLCPFNCHNSEQRGECHQGVCVCEPEWIGDACQFELNLLESSISTTIKNSNSTPERNFIYFKSNIQKCNIMNLNVTTSDCHVDLYTMYNLLPNRTNYDYAVIKSDGDREDLSLNVYYPKNGVWYHAVSSKTNCSFTIELNQLNICPNNCSGNGECVNGECICNSNHSSKDCSTQIIELELNKPHEVNQDVGQIKNFKLNLNNKHNHLEILINTTQESHSYWNSIGNAKVKYDRKPTSISYNSTLDILQNSTNSLKFTYPEEGEWYLSVSSNKAIDYVVNPITEDLCPRNCSGKGTCDKGACKCSEFYISPDCSKYLRNIENDIVLEEKLIHNDWKFYKIKSKEYYKPSLELKMINKEDKLDQIQIYSRKLDEPNFLEYDSLIVCTNDPLCKYGSSKFDGDLVIGIYNPTISDISANLNFSYLNTCLNNCNNNGQCKKGKCECYKNYRGDDCFQYYREYKNSDRILLNEEVQHNKMNYYYYKINIFTTLKFKVSNIRGEPVRIFARPDSSPNLVEYYKTIESSDDQTEIVIKNSELSESGIWHFGVYGEYGHSTFDIIISSSLFCPKNCSGHGTCKSGKCVCDDGWGSSDCSSKIIHIECDKEFSDMVDFQSWNYYTFSVKEKRALEIFILEIGSTVQGLVWSFLANGRFPTVEDNDYKNQSGSLSHTIYVPANESLGTWTLGLTGSPRVPLKYRSSTYRLIILTGCQTYTTCEKCTQDINCGWCRNDFMNSSSGQCVDGNEVGTNEYCLFYRYDTCDLTQDYRNSLSLGILIAISLIIAVCIACCILNVICRSKREKTVEKEPLLQDEEVKGIFQSNIPQITHRYYGSMSQINESMSNSDSSIQVSSIINKDMKITNDIGEE